MWVKESQAPHSGCPDLIKLGGRALPENLPGVGVLFDAASSPRPEQLELDF